VRHEGVVPLLGLSIDRESPGGPPCELSLVMPLMARSLEAAVSAPAASAAELCVRLRWLQQVARTLRFLHGCGLVHGDLRPATVLLDEPEGGSGSGSRALLCGLGGRASCRSLALSAAAAAASLSLSSAAATGVGGGAALGSLRYRDPAVAPGRSLLRAASDVYSFGLLAWHVLAGRPPFEGMDAAGRGRARGRGGARTPTRCPPPCLARCACCCRAAGGRARATAPRPPRSWSASPRPSAASRVNFARGGLTASRTGRRYVVAVQGLVVTVDSCTCSDGRCCVVVCASSAGCVGQFTTVVVDSEGNKSAGTTVQVGV